MSKAPKKSPRKNKHRWLATILTFTLIAQLVPVFKTPVFAEEQQQAGDQETPPSEGSDPATEPETEPTTDQSTEPTTDKPTDPTTEPTTDQPTEPETEPTTDQPTEPTTNPTTEPPLVEEPIEKSDLVKELLTTDKNAQIIVRFKKGMAPLEQTKSLLAVNTGGDLQLAEVAPGSDIDETLKLLREDGRVEYAEPNSQLKMQWIDENLEPIDADYAKQWGMAGNQVNAVDAWAAGLDTLFEQYTVTGEDGIQSNIYDLNGNLELDASDNLQGLFQNASDVIVAVVDTGVDESHEDLMGKVLPGYNAITKTSDQDQPGSSMDEGGHGTHVAGIIASQTGNDEDGDGVATGIAGATGQFPVKILPVKALDKAGVGTVYDISQGIRWAVDHGAHIINLSLGARLPDYPMTLAEAVQYAQDHGAIVVASAGNEGRWVDGFYPASLPGVISVGATESNHHPATFSNRNATVNAPGAEIWSTLPGSRYGEMSGTSQAAAYASGAAALYLSVFPDRGMEKVTEALKLGKRDFPEGCRYEWWGTVCDAHYYVLDMERVLYKNELSSNWFTILEPFEGDDARLSGQSTVSVKVESPSQTKRLVFTLGKTAWDENPILLNDLDTDNGGVIPASGIYSFNWDTSQYPNGSYVLKVTFYSEENGYRYDYDEDVDIVIDNDTTSGLAIQVNKPDGTPASRAWVNVYHPVVKYNEYEKSDYIYYEEIWGGPADLQGKVNLSTTQAIAGNDYLVTARGSGPDFFYYRMVRPPGVVTLNADDAQHITISGRNTDNEALERSVILFELLEGSLPMSVHPDEPVEQDYQMEDIPLTTLNAEGKSEIYLTRGKYNLRLLNGEEIYYLVKRGLEINQQTQSIDFHPQASDVTRVRLAPDGDFSRSSFLLRDESNWFVGFNNLDQSKTATVTPGEYSVEIDAVYPEPSNSREFVWRLDTPKLQLNAGEDHPIYFGPPLHGTLQNFMFEKQYWEKGDYASFQVQFPDLYGNRTLGLSTQPLSSPTLDGTSSTSGGGALMIRQSWEKPTDRNQKAVEGKTYIFNSNSNQFDLNQQASTPVNPFLEITDSEGTPILSGYRAAYLGGGFDADWANAWWSIPTDLADGTYKAVAKMDAGPLADIFMAASPPVSFEVRPKEQQPPVQPAMTVSVLDRNGDPMPNAKVTLVKRNGNNAYEKVAMKYSDQTGVARFEYISPDEGSNYGLITSGSSPDPAQPSNPAENVMWFTPVTLSQPPLAITVNAEGKTMHRMVVQAMDQSGNALTGHKLYAVYGNDGNGVPYGEFFNLYNEVEGDLVLWLPAGDYTVQAHQNQQNDWWDEETPIKPLYYLTKKLNLPTGLSGDGSVSLGGTNLAELNVSSPASQGETPEYYVPSLTLFAEGIPISPVFYTQTIDEVYEEATNEWINVIKKRKLYVTPGGYRAQAALVHKDADGDWDYWLEKDFSLTAGSSPEWSMDDDFQSGIAADKENYGIADRIQFTHDIKDSHQNRLVAAAIGFYLEGFGGYELASGTPGDVGTQNHEEIAPFLSLYNAEGKEIAHKKDAGSNYYTLAYRWGGWWDGESDRGLMPLLQGGSTFFGSEYLVPEEISSGQYKAKLDLGNGPHTFAASETSVTIQSAPGVPVLEDLHSPSNAAEVNVKGSALPGAEVTIRYRLNGGPDVLAGTTTADQTNGSFNVQIPLSEEGSYSFTATAVSDGMTSKPSAPVTLVIDRTPSGAPVGLKGTSPDESHVQLTWTAPAGEEFAHYEIKRDGVLIVNEVTGGQTLTYLDSGLNKETDYSYEVTAIDLAGNPSHPAAIRVRTVSGTDTEPPSPPGNLQAIVNQNSVRLTWGTATDNVGVAGYKIYRSDAGENPVGTVLASSSELAFTDQGLSLNTVYTYTITAYDEAGNESVKDGDTAAKIEVATKELRITSVLWQGGRGTHGFLIPGTTLTLIVVGDKNFQASAVVDYKTLSDAEQVKQASINLVENKDTQGQGMGIYRGTFTLPNDVTSLESIKGVLSDSKGHSVSKDANGFPAGFSGSMVITVHPPDHQALHGADLIAWSDKTKSGGKVILSNGPGTYTIPNLAPANDYVVRMISNSGHDLKKQPNVSVLSGYPSETSIQPDLPVPLEIRVVNVSGESVAGVDVIVSTMAGNPIVKGSSNSTGWVRNTWGSDANQNDPILSTYPAGTELRITTSIPPSLREQYVAMDPVQTTLAADGNELTVTVAKRQTAALEGTVIQNGGDVLSNVTVTAYQSLDGTQITRSAKTDANGRYHLNLFAGKVKLVVLNRHSGSKEFNLEDLAPGENREFNMDLPILGAIALTVFTQRIGSTEYAMDMDWRTAVHLRLNGRNLGHPGKEKNSYFSLWSEFDIIPVNNAEAGDVIEITADGAEANMTKETVRVTLDENAWAKVEIHLKEKGKASAVVRDVQGKSQDGTTRWVEVFKSSEQGKKHVSSFNSKVPDVVTGNLEEGTYTLVYHWGELPYSFMKDGKWLNPRNNYQDMLDYLGPNQAVVKEGVEIKNSEQTDLGAVVLPSPVTSSPGYFRGREGNDFTASKYESSPGGLITMRASYKYSGGAESPENLRLILGLPEKSELIENSVVVHVKQGPEDPPITVQSNAVELNLGNEAVNGLEGTVLYTVKMGDEADWPTSAAQAWAEFTVNGSQIKEDLGSVVISLPYVSLTAPSEVWEREVPVSGRAPAGAEVRIYDASYFLAETAASSNGTWKTTVVLPDRGSKAYHWLRAEVAAPEGGAGSAEDNVIHSEAVRVAYNPEQPHVTGVTMRQTDGREISFSPLGQFPYVFVPGMPFNFNVNFNDSSRISNMQVVADNQAKLGGSSAVSSPSGVAVSGALNGSRTIPGRLYVTYDVLPEPWSRNPSPPDEEEVRKGMPDPWRDSIVNKLEYDDGNPNTAEAKAEVLLGGDPRMKLISTVVVEDRPHYIPTEADRAAVANGGPPVYDFDIDVVEDGDVLRYSLKAVIPNGEIMEQGEMGAQGLETPAKLVWIFGETAIHGGLSLADLYGTLKGAFDFNSYNDKMDSLKDMMQGGCIDPYQQIDLEYEINMAKLDAKSDMVLNLTIQTVFTAVGAIGGFGVGGTIGLAAANLVISSMIGNDQEKNYERIKKKIEDSSDCDPDKEKKPIADPTWILDPSGYVYEAVPQNRLEGVTATALQKVGDEWQTWDAEWFEQENPLVTDAEGRYAWDVPEGLWQVLYQKLGYETARSPELPVPPPQTDINVGLVSLAAPQVTGVTANENSVDIAFDKYMMVSTLSSSTVTVTANDQLDEFGQAVSVSGSVQPVGPQNDPKRENVQLARTFRFTPEQPLSSGEYTVWLSQMVQSYAERTMAQDVSQTVQVKLEGVQLTADKATPQQIGTTIRWTANAEGDGLQYSWYVFKKGVQVQKVLFSPQNYLDWTPVEEGLYQVKVIVRDSNGVQQEKLSDTFAFVPETEAIPFVLHSVTADKVTPQQVGTTIRWTANAEGNGLQYSWYVFRKGVQVQKVLFSRQNYLDWTPTEEGLYQVKVIVKDIYDDQQEKLSDTFAFVPETEAIPFVLHSVTANKVTPQQVGTTIRWTANAEGNGLQYSWYVFRKGVQVQKVLFSRQNYLDWTPTQEGLYQVKVIVKDIYDEQQEKLSDTFAFVPESEAIPFVLHSVTADKATPQQVGTTIRWTTNAEGNGLQYSWYVFRKGVQVQKVLFSRQNYLDWTPTQEGDYQVKVIVKDIYDVQKEQYSDPFTINPGNVAISSVLYSAATEWIKRSFALAEMIWAGR